MLTMCCAGDSRLTKLGEQLLPHLDVFFSDIKGQIQPSVLHGDLWSGNIAAVGGEPAVFDPGE